MVLLVVERLPRPSVFFAQGLVCNVCTFCEELHAKDYWSIPPLARCRSMSWKMPWNDLGRADSQRDVREEV